jgi:hypothetical protein
VRKLPDAGDLGIFAIDSTWVVGEDMTPVAVKVRNLGATSSNPAHAPGEDGLMAMPLPLLGEPWSGNRRQQVTQMLDEPLRAHTEVLENHIKTLLEDPMLNLDIEAGKRLHRAQSDFCKDEESRLEQMKKEAAEMRSKREEEVRQRRESAKAHRQTIPRPAPAPPSTAIVKEEGDRQHWGPSVVTVTGGRVILAQSAATSVSASSTREKSRSRSKRTKAAPKTRQNQNLTRKRPLAAEDDQQTKLEASITGAGQRSIPELFNHQQEKPCCALD